MTSYEVKDKHAVAYDECQEQNAQRMEDEMAAGAAMGIDCEELPKNKRGKVA